MATPQPLCVLCAIHQHEPDPLPFTFCNAGIQDSAEAPKEEHVERLWGPICHIELTEPSRPTGPHSFALIERGNRPELLCLDRRAVAKPVRFRCQVRNRTEMMLCIATLSGSGER